jgi:hypothetical protein
MEKIRIRDKHPGSATLPGGVGWIMTEVFFNEMIEYDKKLV